MRPEQGNGTSDEPLASALQGDSLGLAAGKRKVKGPTIYIAWGLTLPTPLQRSAQQGAGLHGAGFHRAG